MIEPPMQPRPAAPCCCFPCAVRVNSAQPALLRSAPRLDHGFASLAADISDLLYHGPSNLILQTRTCRCELFRHERTTHRKFRKEDPIGWSSTERVEDKWAMKGHAAYSLRLRTRKYWGSAMDRLIKDEPLLKIRVNDACCILVQDTYARHTPLLGD